MYTLEFGEDVDLVEPESYYVNCDILTEETPEFINAESLSYMYYLQQSGATNMFESVPYVIGALSFSADDAKTLLLFYIKNYNKIYNPEEEI